MSLKIILSSKHNKAPKINAVFFHNSVSEVKTDIEMGEGPYYEKINDTTFIVFFNIGFDDKIIFNSNSKRWK